MCDAGFEPFGVSVRGRTRLGGSLSGTLGLILSTACEVGLLLPLLQMSKWAERWRHPCPAPTTPSPHHVGRGAARIHTQICPLTPEPLVPAPGAVPLHTAISGTEPPLLPTRHPQHGPHQKKAAEDVRVSARSARDSEGMLQLETDPLSSRAPLLFSH